MGKVWGFSWRWHGKVITLLNQPYYFKARVSGEVDSNDHGVAGNLSLTARNSEPNALLSDWSLISKPKSNFLTHLVTESYSNPRTLWKTLNSILHRNPSNSSPDTPDTQSLANSFLQFFSDKIERIRSKFSQSDYPIPLILFFFQLSLLQIYLISIRPLSQKFVISFSLLKTNNVNLTRFLLSFWNSVLTNLALLSLIS